MNQAEYFYKNLTSILGGKEVIGRVPRNEAELYGIAEKGVGLEALTNNANFFNFTFERIEEILETPSLKNPFEKIVKRTGFFAWVNLDIGGNVLEQKGIYTFKTDLKILSEKKDSRLMGKAPYTKGKSVIAKPIFNERTSEHLTKLAELISRGNEVFENEDKFKRWLNTPIGAFQGKKPIEYIDTITGIEMILDELGRIEHGIFY